MLVRLVAGPQEAQGQLVIRASVVRSVCGPTAFALDANTTEVVIK